MLAQRISVSEVQSLDSSAAKVALLGSGTVGVAVLRRLSEWRGTPFGRQLKLVFAANTRLSLCDVDGLNPEECALALVEAPRSKRRTNPSDMLAALGNDGTRIVIDATADAQVASNHPALLDAGIHVATACKLAAGTSLSLWQEIEAACERRGSGFGDRATVGAGLPLLRSLRELRKGGDRIHAIAGVMSGSLAWLFNRFDGSRPFSELVREAHAKGFTEPDPREDLSGEDVRRKILILARTAGFPLESSSVDVETLVPVALATLGPAEVLGQLQLLDEPLLAKLKKARADGNGLRFVARLQGGSASVKLEAIETADPLAGGSGTDNRVAIWSDRYREQPLVIQGPGAGATVTAAALLDDALRLNELANAGYVGRVAQRDAHFGH